MICVGSSDVHENKKSFCMKTTIRIIGTRIMILHFENMSEKWKESSLYRFSNETVSGGDMCSVCCWMRYYFKVIVEKSLDRCLVLPMSFSYKIHLQVKLWEETQRNGVFIFETSAKNNNLTLARIVFFFFIIREFVLEIWAVLKCTTEDFYMALFHGK